MPRQYAKGVPVAGLITQTHAAIDVIEIANVNETVETAKLTGDHVAAQAEMTGGEAPPLLHEDRVFSKLMAGDCKMPLRDHFRAPLDNITAWEGFHGGWPMMIVASLARKLPAEYVAAPRVHLGSFVEIDIATYEKDEAAPSPPSSAYNGGGVATATWAPARPTLAVESDLVIPDEYEVNIYDLRRGRRLVAAIEIVSPSNKDRPEHRRAFVAKCATLLKNQVSVAIVDLVTTRAFNLYRDLLDFIGHPVPSGATETPIIYAAACRGTKKDRSWIIETWENPLAIGQPLPTLPLWLADNFAIPLELEECYEETCRVLRIA